jgi:hypothetical protein
MVRIHARQLVQAETLTLHRHSSLLRETLCETLVLLSVHGNELFRERLGLDVEGQVNEVIRDLLTPVDPTNWQSQQHDLPRYAEAAPNVFLDVLEEDLRSDDPKVYALMAPLSPAYLVSVLEPVCYGRLKFSLGTPNCSAASS